MTNKSSWWSRASQSERLAQIDGGIEVGMNARQIAFNLGAERKAVLDFGGSHGRIFKAKASLRARSLAGRIGGVLKARQSGKPEFEICSAFEIFDKVAPSLGLDEVAA